MSEMPSREPCRPVALSVLWSCLLTALLGAAATRAQIARNLTEDIPGQPLAEALAEYARQTGVQVVYVSEIVRGKSSKGAPAGLRPRAALARLLDGTGLQFELLNERSVHIFAMEPPLQRAPIR